MAIVSCISAVAKSIAPNCDNPLVGGYTGRAILIPVNNPNTTITQSSSNKRIVESISATSEETPLANIIAVENYVTTPFEGSNKASNADGGVMEYTKTVSFQIPLRGAGNSKDIVEPLSKNPLGYIAILEKKDKVGDGSFEVVGLLQGLKVNADGISQDEATNRGAVVVTMSCVESWFECALLHTDYATTLADFETLYALGV